MSKLQKGQKTDSGFIILDVIDLWELRSQGIWAKHEKTGAEVFHVLNDDTENLFSFAFNTFPEDSTGVAHILEHSVLCGSERYPLKDAFLVLAQGSLQTFLNAMTFPDKTIYPASSTNESDYFNLMGVYGDAVFRPLLSEFAFMQEGHRLEYDKNGKLFITGVVYNEMKGAFSSLDSYAGYWSVKAALPGTPYAFESGGDPVEIPNLDLNSFKEFHRTRYSPANCRVFLAGNISTEKQLKFLNDNFFGCIEGGVTCKSVEKTKRWDSPKQFHIPCPAGSDKKSTIFISWLCGDVIDFDETMALLALSEILLGHDGSPLTRTLIESGLGEDVSPVSGLESEIRESLFITGLKGVSGDAREMSGKIEKLIIDKLTGLVKEGIPKEEIEAALLSMEFSQREIRRAGGSPFSLVWMRRSLRTWIHGCKPWDSLLLEPPLQKLKENIAKNDAYFESLIQKYFLDNPHRALVVVEPQEDFLPKQEAHIAELLNAKEKEMNESDKQAIIDNSRKLEEFQSEGDSPQALATIPHLSRKDLSTEIDYIPRKMEDLNGIPALCHDLYTNGITYIDLAFPVDTLSAEDYSWLPFFSRAIVSVGLPGMDYGKTASLLARTVGGFAAMLHNSAAVPGAAVSPFLDRDWIIYRVKCLDEKTAASLDLVQRLITEADFTDHRRIRDLVLEMKTEADSSLAPMGHVYASGRAGRFNSISRQTDEIWSGLSQLYFVHKLAETDTAEIVRKLLFLQKKIAASGLIANITGTAIASAGTEISKRFSQFGKLAPCNPKTMQEPSSSAEVYASPSLQVGFAALTLNSAPFDSNEQIAELVLAHQLSTGELWEDVRMKGGAYGAFVSSDSRENCFSFASYRDPNPLRSLGIFGDIAKKGSKEDCSEDNLVKSIIGCYAKETRPKTSEENGLLDFYRFLYGIDDGYRQRRKNRLVNVSTSDIEALSLASRKASVPVIITGVNNAKEAAQALSVDVKMLPV
jgi:Zn-dependent M16 (insulinase) family peptidase